MMLIALMGVVLAFGLVHAVLDVVWGGQIEKGVTVLGIDVGAMSEEEARTKLQEELDFPQLESDIVMEFDGSTWNLPLSDIAGYLDLDAMIEAAHDANKSVLFYDRWFRRTLALGMTRDIGPIYNYDEDLFATFMDELEQTINRQPVNAEIMLNSGELVSHNATDGWLLDREAANTEVLAAFGRPDHAAELPIAVTPPQVHDDQIGQVIVVNTRTHRLTLYNNMQVEREYPIACGSAAYPTPKGTWKVVSKQKNPTWVNPGTPWASTMPPYIPPGPGNPLGTRAIQTSASGVFIHGTYNSGSIGYSVSHGCIRMLIKDSEALFEIVEVGIPVLIWAG
jgi:lipoprotein-anchoring transpeptidase ErfK/SrfK